MKIFVLTGAGTSAESGLGTFRGREGLWAKFDPYRLATPEAFAARPEEVHRFYNLRRRNLLEAAPNAAHRALARLEATLHADLFLCTQNVDDLHERAGSRRVVHMHGELLKALCVQCGLECERRTDLGCDDVCESCGAKGALRPAVVWFGEVPRAMQAIEAALERSDLFVSIGTSGTVYPAAGFAARARELGLKTCEINLASSPTDVFDERRLGPASVMAPAWVDEILREIA